MNYITGVFKRKIFINDSTGYLIGLIKVKETDYEDFDNKTVTFTGYFADLIEEDTYKLTGEIVRHDKYGLQFNATSYQKYIPETKDGLIEFLSSSIFKGIGKTTAKKIIDTLGKDALKIISESPNNLIMIPGITKNQINIITSTLDNYQDSYEIIVKLNEYGFNNKESMLIYKKYHEQVKTIIDENIYLIYEDIEKITFKKIDFIARNNNISETAKIRIKAGLIYVFKEVTNNLGHSFYYKDELYNYLNRALMIDLDYELFNESLDELITDLKVINIDDKYYLKDMYEAENYIVRRLGYLVRSSIKETKNLDKFIDDLEKYNDIFYNEEQRYAIKNSFLKNILVITGGPGTGKTTLINGIVNLYKNINKYSNKDLDEKMALLAPTGRASKRLAESTLYKASTIHRFLKWNKENNTFQIDEFNKSGVEFIIIDESSMIDVYLFTSLLKGIKTTTKIIIVGDYDQLPSVGPGQVLKDIIDSGVITTIKLEHLYRQEEGSSIIKLAYDINKDNNLKDDFNNKDSFFLNVLDSHVKDNILEICKDNIDYDFNKIQVLAPMYKGLNGIDQINIKLQDLYNPKGSKKNEIIINDCLYRENDKVIQLVNMIDNNVFNGDIGFIKRIKNGKEKEVEINFDGNLVIYKPSDFNNFKHAYAISIHKSQGSEFDIVIVPIVQGYGKMLYRKLIYTAITRAKKKLYIVGNFNALENAVNNNLQDIRKTTLKDMLIKSI